jgi:hypothetical protein
VSLRAKWQGVNKRGDALDISSNSLHLAELWIPRSRRGIAILDDRLFDIGKFGQLRKVLEQLCEDKSVHNQQIGIEIDAVALLKDLRELALMLQDVRNWPYRYWFAPAIECRDHLPLYAWRKMSTGLMESGFNLCYINRNWDGIERIDDLTQRDELLDAEGTIQIIRHSLWRHLGKDLKSWIALLERGNFSRVSLSFTPIDHTADLSILEVLNRAENWRLSVKIPDYRPIHMQHVQEIWQQMMKQSQLHLGSVLGLAAYVAELVRASWGGQYQTIEAHKAAEALNTAPITKITSEQRKNIERLKSKITPSVTLKLPFGKSIMPLHQAAEAMVFRRSISWKLQYDILEAHQRQSGLIADLGCQLYSALPSRSRAALRLIEGISDIRIDQMLIERLITEKDELHLCIILERIENTPHHINNALLAELAHHCNDAVAARAIWILFCKKVDGLPALLEQILSGGQRIPLRPLARHILSHWNGTQAKRILRLLGPIPPALSVDSLLPILPKPWPKLPLLSEIMENCANPAKRETALNIISLWPDRTEEDTLGAALADPEPMLRCMTIGLIAESNHPKIRELLRTRLMFESDPLCRQCLQAALAPDTQNT